MAVAFEENTIIPVAAQAAGGAQSNAASLPGAANKTTWIEGFDISGGGASGTSVIEITVTGLASSAGSTLKYEMNILGVAAGPVNAQGGMSVRFPEPLPASGLNTAIVVTAPSFGAGNTNASVTAYGFQK